MKAPENKAQPDDKTETVTKAQPSENKTQSAATQSTTATPANKTSDAVALLKADHRKVEELFAQFESAKDDGKADIVRQVCNELIVHAMLEEEIFYPACREKNVEDDALDEAQVEHDGAKVLISDLLKADPGADFYDAKVKVLSEYIKHHVKEEEQSGSGIFAKANAAGVDMAGLGAKLQARKQDLMKQAEANRLEAPKPKSLVAQTQKNPRQEANSMARYGSNDRDDRGRFTNDDNRGGYSRRDDDDDRRYSSRDRDDRGRYASDNDDDRRGSYNRDRDDDRRYGSGASNDRDRDDRGRFTSSDDRGGHARYRDDDDDRRYGRSSSGRDDRYDNDRGRSGDGRGWYGDSEGHRRAAEQRSDRNGSSRSRRDDEDDDRRYNTSGDRDRDDRGRYMSDDDRGGRSRARDDDDDRRYGRSSTSRDDDDRGRSGDGRGWFGDSEGHRRAAEQRSDRGGSSRSSRDDDDRSSSGRYGRNVDHDRGSRSASSRDDDRHRSSSTRSRGSDDRREGHGGWFGDSRGHAEAARRGWQNRD